MEEMATQRYYFLQFLILAFIIILILVVLVFILVYRCASKAKQNEIDSLKGSCETSVVVKSFVCTGGTCMVQAVSTTGKVHPAQRINHNCKKRTPDRSQFDSPMVTPNISARKKGILQPRKLKMT